MTGLYHSPLFTQIREYFKHDSKNKTIFLFVPYIKTAVLEKLLNDISNKIVIVTTWRPQDIRLGSSELELYPYCKRNGISLYVNENLHLKIYSINLENAILATGNISQRGLLPDGNHEMGILIQNLTNRDRLFFEGIRNEARLVNDSIYKTLKEWIESNKIEKPYEISLEDIIPEQKKDNFLISALPMTQSIDELVLGYTRINDGKKPSDDQELSACIFHDLVNYNIKPGLSKEEFENALAKAFFIHPFIQKIDEFISPEAYFGRIKEWIQSNCTDVPIPSRRELTENVQVLLKWFVSLGNGKYRVDIPGARSQRIRKIRLDA